MIFISNYAKLSNMDMITVVLILSFNYHLAPPSNFGQPIVSDLLQQIQETSQFAKELVQRHIIQQGTTVLSLGCGTAIDESYFAQLGASVIATDNKDQLLAEAFKRASHNLKIHKMDVAQPFNLAHTNFDVVYARLLLHYFGHSLQKQILEQAHNLLPSHGKLVFELKSKNDWLYQKSPKVAKNDGLYFFPDKGYSRNHLNKEEVETLLKATGFEIISIIEIQETLYGDKQPSTLLRVIAQKRNIVTKTSLSDTAA